MMCIYTIHDHNLIHVYVVLNDDGFGLLEEQILPTDVLQDLGEGRPEGTNIEQFGIALHQLNEGRDGDLLRDGDEHPTEHDVECGGEVPHRSGIEMRRHAQVLPMRPQHTTIEEFVCQADVQDLSATI